MHRCADAVTKGQKDGRMVGNPERSADSGMRGWMDGSMGGWINGWKGRRKEKQKDEGTTGWKEVGILLSCISPSLRPSLSTQGLLPHAENAAHPVDSSASCPGSPLPFPSLVLFASKQLSLGDQLPAD